MSRRPNTAKLQAECDAFNAKHPVGTSVMLKKDFVPEPVSMLEYKCHQAGVVYSEVPEHFTTQTCNVCGVIAGPKGLAGLNKRVWQCACGSVNDRDVNAALNIRARGLASLEAGAGAVTPSEQSRTGGIVGGRQKTVRAAASIGAAAIDAGQEK